ncbi:hypothetical protein NESM_000060700 [Novymonas esmeraldas]|uniref:DUF4042 domain-containing protein n=1 Tax=Novymonas esmeraldas TaxID=1808958 RepID=A0AAW0F2M0_9TRYP
MSTPTAPSSSSPTSSSTPHHRDGGGHPSGVRGASEWQWSPAVVVGGVGAPVVVEGLAQLHEMMRASAAARVAVIAQAVQESSGGGGGAGSASGGHADVPQKSVRGRGGSRTAPLSTTPGSGSGTTPMHVDAAAALATTTAAATPLPPLSLVLECATLLSADVAQWRAHAEWVSRQPPPPPHAESGRSGNLTKSPAAPPPPPPPPHPKHVLLMLEMLLWYCVSTTEQARLAAAGGSRGTSGLATPAHAGAGGGGGGGGTAGVGGRGRRSGVGVGRSGSCSAEPMAALDWLGSRMSAASPATAAAPSVTVPEAQLAARLLRPVVDAVVLLQFPKNSAAPLTRRFDAPHTSGAEHTARGAIASATIAAAIQVTALWTLTAVLVRFADVPVNGAELLPLLFPPVDVRGDAGADERHPLLQPLLRGGTLQSLACSAAAAATVTTLLRALRPTLQYAEESKGSRLSAYLSLGAQCGAMLASVHESLCWAMEQALPSPSPNAAGEPSSSSLSSSASVATPVLLAYATVAAVTPYHRCPRSRAAALQTLQLPRLHFYLAHDETAAFVPAMTLVSNLFRNESMRGASAELLVTLEGGEEEVVVVESHNNHGGSGGGGDSVERAGAGGKAATAAVSDATGTGLLHALLSHAGTRVEVWMCMVPLSRLYPRLVLDEFDVLLAASTAMVESLASWEAAERAMDAAAVAGGVASAAPWQDHQHQHQQQQLPTAGDREAGDGGDGTPPGQRSPAPSAAAGTTATSTLTPPPLLPPRRRTPTATLKAFAECLRTWLHFMGYVWKAFDDNASDPAQRPEAQADRATLEHKRRLHEVLYRPAMRLRRCGEDVRTMTLRCIAQIGNDYMCTVADRAVCEELVAYAQTCAADAQPRVRGEALTTWGVWLWQYTSMDDFACAGVDSAVHTLMTDPNALVRTKAAFALSNVTGRLSEGSCAVVGDSPDYIATLCVAAMHAAVIDGDSGVQGHGIRMMNHLLQVLSFEDLIGEVEGFEEGVAEGFLRVLLECLRATTHASGGGGGRGGGGRGGGGGGGGDTTTRYTVPREAKHRWNAACALGMGLSRRDVFEAEPKYAVQAVDALCTAVVHDHTFKVRTQAAGALSRVPSECLSGAFSATDLTPTVVDSLCMALQTATSTDNFKQYREQGTLHDALHAALSVMITSAAPSNELEKVFARYTKLLKAEALL